MPRLPNHACLPSWMVCLVKGAKLINKIVVFFMIAVVAWNEKNNMKWNRLYWKKENDHDLFCPFLIMNLDSDTQTPVCQFRGFHLIKLNYTLFLGEMLKGKGRKSMYHFFFHLSIISCCWLWYKRSCGDLYESLADTDPLYNNVLMTNISIL